MRQNVWMSRICGVKIRDLHFLSTTRSYFSENYEVYNLIKTSKDQTNTGPIYRKFSKLFPSKVRCRFIQYVPDKQDKFEINFWLERKVISKYTMFPKKIYTEEKK